MKQITITVLMLLSLAIVGQNRFDKEKYWKELPYDTICLSEMTYLNLKLETTKSEMYNQIGKPDKIVMPKYECGGFSDEWQGEIFIQYYYNTLNFIGSGEDLIIERIDFKANPSITILYKGVKMNSKTTIETFAKLFPKSNNNIRKEKDEIIYFYILPALVTDDIIIVTFKKGLLAVFRYNSPC